MSKAIHDTENKLRGSQEELETIRTDLHGAKQLNQVEVMCCFMDLQNVEFGTHP